MLMYSQHSSEKPVQNNPTTISHNKPHFISRHSCASFRGLLGAFSKSIKSVIVIIMAVVILISTVMCAYCLEGTGNVGFKPDFQNNKANYSSRNTLFDTEENTSSVKLTLYGDMEFEADVSAITVGELIDSYSITLNENDIINYSTDEYVFDGMEITVDAVTVETHTNTIELPYTTEVRESQTVPEGTVNVIQAGVNGSVTETVTETYVNGVLTESEVYRDTETEVIPTTEIIEKGVGGVYTDCHGNSYEYSYYMDVVATAYGTLSGITATGKAIDYGMIAVDPRVIPLGTKVYLTGSTYGDMGVHSAEDTGGSIKGNKIDVFLGDDYNTLMQFGRRTMRIYILK